MKPKISILTLAVNDLEKATAFFDLQNGLKLAF